MEVLLINIQLASGVRCMVTYEYAKLGVLKDVLFVDNSLTLDILYG